MSMVNHGHACLLCPLLFMLKCKGKFLVNFFEYCVTCTVPSHVKGFALS